MLQTRKPRSLQSPACGLGDHVEVRQPAQQQQQQAGRGACGAQGTTAHSCVGGPVRPLAASVTQEAPGRKAHQHSPLRTGQARSRGRCARAG